MKTTVVTALCTALAVSACASKPDNIRSQYVSPAQYASFDCQAIETDLRAISQEVQILSGQQRRRADQDAWATGVGIVVFWPALFFLMRGDKQDQLANMKGQYEALVAQSRRKDCTGLQMAMANPIQ